MRKKLPAKLSAELTFTDIDVDGTRLIYIFDVAGEISEKADLAAIRRDRMPEYCTTLKSLYRPAEVEAFRHHMRFSDGRTLDIDVDMSDCRAEPGKRRAEGPGNFLTRFEDNTGIDLEGVPDVD